MPKLVKPYRFDRTITNFDEEFLNSTKEIRLKEAYNDVGMFAFVSWKWVNPFVKWLDGRKCLEVMAGRGWLTHALRQKGVNVIATDNFSWAKKRNWEEPLTPVDELDAIDSVRKFGADIDILIMAWPYMDDTAYEVIKELHKVNPSALVVYIGEGGGGCTASDLFFEHFKEEDDDTLFNRAAAEYERWEYLHDLMFLGQYVEEIED